MSKVKVNPLSKVSKKLSKDSELPPNLALIFSHDLLQPLRQAANFLELLTTHLNPVLIRDPVALHAVTAIQKGLQQAYILSEGITTYYKSGTLALNSEPICLRSLIEEIKQSCFEDQDINLSLALKSLLLFKPIE